MRYIVHQKRLADTRQKLYDVILQVPPNGATLRIDRMPEKEVKKLKTGDEVELTLTKATESATD